MSIEHLHAVPNLTTALTGPLLTIEQHLLERQPAIEAWLRAQWLETPAPFYCSVDLRNAGFTLAPVDTNLFPAGFNNLNPAFMPLCIQAVQSAIERVCPAAAKVLLIPENHTRNQFYMESVATLLNIDLSDGRPPILENLDQPVVPPLGLGWFNRLKSNHFTHYRAVAREFSEIIDIDPWLIDPLFLQCGEINFTKREGEDCVARNVDTLVANIQRKYDEHGIDKQPFVVVKADAGTY